MELFIKVLVQFLLAFTLMLVLLETANTGVTGNVVIESDHGCSVREIGVFTTNYTAFFEDASCSRTYCQKTCAELGFYNATCTTKPPPFWKGQHTGGCVCSGNDSVRLTGREIAGNYQLNNWTFFWTGCKSLHDCKATCTEGSEKMVEALCMPWPNHLRICACQPEKPLPITSWCGNTYIQNELPKPKKSIIGPKIDEPTYFTKARIAVHMGVILGWEILGQIIILML